MALTWLDSVAERIADPEVAGAAQKMHDMFDRKLWHDLTLAMHAAALDPKWGPVLPEMYGKFVSHFEHKMNPLFLALFLVAVSRRIPDPRAGVDLIVTATAAMKQAPFFNELHRRGVLVLNCEEAVQSLHASGPDSLLHAKGLAEGAAEYVAKYEAHELPVELRAHTYRAQAAVHKAENKYNEFYKCSLLYLAHVKMESEEDMPVAERQRVAFDLGVAALLGDEIHNFGELINNPIIEALPAAGNEWLQQLLKCFNVGDLAAYDKITAEHADKLREHVGEGKAQQLRKKIQLMALLYHIFVTPVTNRHFKFQKIHEVCHTGTKDDVEPLLLHALALGLIRGSIDQVAETISVSWVQSRVLGREEIGQMVQQVKQWSGRVQETIRSVEETVDSHIE